MKHANFKWRTAKGEILYLYEITDEHLTNIIIFLKDKINAFHANIEFINKESFSFFHLNNERMKMEYVLNIIEEHNESRLEKN